jgi:chromosome partitioning protein
MVTKSKAVEESIPELRKLVQHHGDSLSKQLQDHHRSVFPPEAQKTIRRFSAAEAASMIGIVEGYLRQIAAATHLIAPAPAGRRSYSVEDMRAIRQHLHANARGSRRYLPYREDGEHIQVLAVMNFKGGSGKTTTAAHLAQYLALRGHRVLTIDLDPQASLTALFGLQPEFDVGRNETIYGAIRYDDQRRPMSDIVRSTYIPDLHLVPGNLELMEFEHDTPAALQRKLPGDAMFFARVGQAIGQVENNYDVVVIDCPPQLGFLTLSALTAATGVLVTVHPQMLDVMSMSQFLLMTGDLLEEVSKAGASDSYDFMKYVVTRFEPSDGPQNQMVGFLRSIFGKHVLNHTMLKSTAVSDAGLTNQTLFEVDRAQFTRSTYDRAIDAMNAVNREIENSISKAWGRVE